MHRAVAGLVLLDEDHDLRGELVRPLGPAWFGQQARYTVAHERRFGLVERRARHPEERGRLGFGGAIDTEVAQHFVLALDQVAGVEEIARLEQRRAYALGVAIENALTVEPFALGVGFGQVGVLRDRVVIYYTPPLMCCQQHLRGVLHRIHSYGSVDFGMRSNAY